MTIIGRARLGDTGTGARGQYRTGRRVGVAPELERRLPDRPQGHLAERPEAVDRAANLATRRADFIGSSAGAAR
jgi:hypothetical protein